MGSQQLPNKQERHGARHFDRGETLIGSGAVCHYILEFSVRVPNSISTRSLAKKVLPDDNRRMTAVTRTQYRYEQRLKKFVREAGNIGVALEEGVPRSNVRLVGDCRQN